tara:strand:- start:41231 stop:41398 length:168 start_codon:yes stop_codon:yes gene_type:complete
MYYLFLTSWTKRATALLCLELISQSMLAALPQESVKEQEERTLELYQTPPAATFR